MIEQRLSELNFATLTDREFFPSPAAWEDQVLYFLMLDRFSDGKEKGYRDNAGNIVAGGITPMFKNEDRGNATRTAEERSRWFEAGGKFAGGTLKGLANKMGYLKRLKEKSHSRRRHVQHFVQIAEAEIKHVIIHEQRQAIAH